MDHEPSIAEHSGPLTLAIIGAGKAGRSFAGEAVRAGYRVFLEDVLPSRLREALSEIPTQGMPGSLQLVTEVEDAVREADIVVDFVPDELESKLEVVSLIDRMAPPRTVLCVPTAVLEIDDLASCTYRPQRCVGMQWTGEAVALQAASRTGEDVMQMVEAFWQSLGKQVTRHAHDAKQAV